VQQLISRRCLAGFFEQHPEIGYVSGGFGAVPAVQRRVDRERPPVELGGAREITLVPEHIREVGARHRQLGTFGTEFVLGETQRDPFEPLCFVQLMRAFQQVAQRV